MLMNGSNFWRAKAVRWFEIALLAIFGFVCGFHFLAGNISKPWYKEIDSEAVISAVGTEKLMDFAIAPAPEKIPTVIRNLANGNRMLGERWRENLHGSQLQAELFAYSLEDGAPVQKRYSEVLRNLSLKGVFSAETLAKLQAGQSVDCSALLRNMFACLIDLDGRAAPKQLLFSAQDATSLDQLLRAHDIYRLSAGTSRAMASFGANSRTEPWNGDGLGLQINYWIWALQAPASVARPVQSVNLSFFDWFVLIVGPMALVLVGRRVITRGTRFTRV